MSPREIELVQASWPAVRAIQEPAAALFYGRLFELDPALKPLFRRDLATQGRMLMAAIDAVVIHLHRLGELLPTVQAMARRHVGYGVQPPHYDTVAAALLWTLGQGLGPAFTPELHAAWAQAYGTLAGAMCEAAYGSLHQASADRDTPHGAGAASAPESADEPRTDRSGSPELASAAAEA